MSTTAELNAKFTEFTEWIENILSLDDTAICNNSNEIKLHRRNFSKFYSEVQISQDDALMAKFATLKGKFRDITAIANGQTSKDKIMQMQSTKQEEKSQSPEPDANTTASSSAQKSCVMGKDCTSTDPQHFYDVIHFDHAKAQDMIAKYHKMAKKQKCQQIYEQHATATATNSGKDEQVAAEFAQLLSDEEMAQQLQAMQDIDMNADDSNGRPRRTRTTRQTATYTEEQEEDGNSDDEEEEEEDDDDDDEDFDEEEARTSHRRKVRNRRKEDERIKLEEETMDEAELEKLRTDRLNKLLSKTEAYMKTVTRRVRKNFKENTTPSTEQPQQQPQQLSTTDVRDFLCSDNSKFIEQTPSLVGGTLKDYQQVGLRWMVTLNQMRLNGILADEMGLGKTVQVLALLAYVLDTHSERGKHLIVVPLSTLSSWTDHFDSWLPSLKVYRHRGDAETRRQKLLELKQGTFEADVVVSTYQMVTRDAESLSPIAWNYLIVDEAHTLKNAQGKLFAALNAFSTRHRLLLTGTPLQNNLGELWSLLNFILPTIFDSAQSFESWFCSPFQHLHNKDKNVDLPMTDQERLMVMDRLHRAIDPFLLRRMKVNVLPQMVKKEEIVIKVPISGMQRVVYQQLQKFGALKYKNEARRTNFNNILMQLRKCANHPYLFAPTEYDINDEIYRSSGKFLLLRHLIPKMNRFSHRMLIFCQFVQTMDILSEFLDFIQEPFLRIDGGTDSDDRIEQLSTFNKASTATQQQQYSVFLLSTRACGLGLNLYSADTVILFDSDWNPQQDLQAMARCHRIGQTREVRVFRLISDGTVEESIYDRAQTKLDLERKAIECGKFDFSISGAERKEFLERILHQRTTVNNKYESDIERTKLNQLLSRTEEEWKEFEAMDAQNENEFKALLVDDTVPDWLELITTQKEEKQALPAKRSRKMVKSYGDMVDIDAVLKEEDEDEEGIEDKENEKEEADGNTKKKRTRKRKRKEICKESVDGEAESVGQASKKRKTAA